MCMGRDVDVRHVACMNTSCFVYEYGMSHTSIRHVSYMNTSCLGTNTSCRTHEYVMSHARIRHEWARIRHVACHSIMSHISIRRFSCRNTSCFVYEYVMSHTSIRHVACMNTSCLIYLCFHVAHSYEVATTRRLLKSISVFCERTL